MGFADLGGAQVGTGYETVDERRLAHTAVAAEQRDFACKQRAKRFHAVARLSRNLTTLVADGLVERHHHLLVAALVVVEQVGLVKDEDDGHAVSLCRG